MTEPPFAPLPTQPLNQQMRQPLRQPLRQSPTPPPSQPLIQWEASHSTGWNQRPMRLAHTLHQHPALQLDALAALVGRYPAQDCALMLTRRQGEGGQRWRQGERAGLPGGQVVDAIAAGSLWLNLREVHRHGAAYAGLLQAAYAQISANVPGFAAGALKMGILISSPQVQVDFHCDLPGQLLWQIHGHKRVWVYPPHAPFLRPEWLEDIAYTGFEFRLQYDPQFDREALVFDLAPGQMLTWPLNSPHRVDNGDMLNVSVTTEHWTAHNRRSQRLNLANALLRHHLGWRQPGRALSGPAFWAKSALQAAWRASPWARQAQRPDRAPEFRLAPDQPAGWVDLVAGAAAGP